MMREILQRIEASQRDGALIGTGRTTRACRYKSFAYTYYLIP